MLETTACCALAWLLLAAQSHRFRREVGPLTPRAVAGLRLAAALVFAVALLRAGAALPGERWVRLIGGASVGAILCVGLLSVAPGVLARVGRAVPRGRGAAGTIRRRDGFAVPVEARVAAD